MDKKNKKIVVAMSGGVDSSVAAALLKRDGFEVVGIFMKFWKDGKSDENRCCSVESENLARLVAKEIGIPFYVINAEKEFKKKVVDYFLKEYKEGNTPNPCVVCNREIKFGVLMEKAMKLGADFVATGHYARFKDGKLFKGKDKEKDQSYFLWQLNQNQLRRVLFPVGEYTKPEVRKLAQKFKLPTAETPESQEVCFIQNQTNDFLKKYLKTKPGKIVDLNGDIIGQHQGLWFYTIGQRKGLNINQGPYYAVKKDFKNNILVVSKDEKDLLGKELIAKDINWISGENDLSVKIKCKIRYKSELASVLVEKSSGKTLKIIFEKPQKSITPGQSVVFYKVDELFGGGTIDKII